MQFTPYCPLTQETAREEDVITNLQHSLKGVVREMDSNSTGTKGQRNVFCSDLHEEILNPRKTRTSA
jgi:hypothetical protein